MLFKALAQNTYSESKMVPAVKDTLKTMNVNFYQIEFPKFPTFDKMFSKTSNIKNSKEDANVFSHNRRRVHFRLPPDEVEVLNTKHSTDLFPDNSEVEGSFENVSDKTFTIDELSYEHTQEKPKDTAHIENSNKIKEYQLLHSIPISEDASERVEVEIGNNCQNISDPDNYVECFNSQNDEEFDVNSETTSIETFKTPKQVSNSFRMKSFDEYLNMNKEFMFSDAGSDLIDLKNYENDSPEMDTLEENTDNPSLLGFCQLKNKDAGFFMDLTDDSKSPTNADNFL